MRILVKYEGNTHYPRFDGKSYEEDSENVVAVNDCAIDVSTNVVLKVGDVVTIRFADAKGDTHDLRGVVESSGLQELLLEASIPKSLPRRNRKRKLSGEFEYDVGEETAEKRTDKKAKKSPGSKGLLVVGDGQDDIPGGSLILKAAKSDKSPSEYRDVPVAVQKTPIKYTSLVPPYQNEDISEKYGSSSQQTVSPSNYSPPVLLKPSHFLSVQSGSPKRLQVPSPTSWIPNQHIQPMLLHSVALPEALSDQGIKFKKDNTAACLDALCEVVAKVQVQQQLQTVETNEILKLVKEQGDKIERSITELKRDIVEKISEVTKIQSHLKLKQDQIVTKQDLLYTVASVNTGVASAFASDPMMSPPHSCPSYHSRPIPSPASSGHFKPRPSLNLPPYVPSLPVHQPLASSTVNVVQDIPESVDKFLDDICSLASWDVENLNNSEISSNLGLTEYPGVPEPSGAMLNVDDAVETGNSNQYTNKYAQIKQYPSYGQGGASACNSTPVMLQATSGTGERLKTVEEVLDENKDLCTQGNVCKLAVKLATDAVFGGKVLGKSSLSGRADGSERLDENKLEMLQMILQTKLYPDMPISSFRNSIWPSCRQVIGEVCKRYRKKNRKEERT